MSNVVTSVLPAPPAKAAGVHKTKAVLRSIGTRLVQLVVLLFAMSTLLFFLLRLSGDPASLLAPEDADPATVDAVRARYGLDQPPVVQYVLFLGQLVQADFGLSLYSGQSATLLVLQRIPTTVSLAGMAILVTVAIAIPLGVWLGAKSGGGARNAVTVVISALQGIPGFVTGLLLIQVFAVWLRWLPSIAGITFASTVLPTVTLAAFMVPQLVRVISSATREVIRNDYVRTATANGAGSARTLLAHVLPNALLSTAAMIGAQFAALLSGALITEFVFAWPGLGLLLVDAVGKLDFPVVQAAVFFIAIMVFFVNLLVDLAFQFVDPRLRKKAVVA